MIAMAQLAAAVTTQSARAASRAAMVCFAIVRAVA